MYEWEFPYRAQARAVLARESTPDTRRARQAEFEPIAAQRAANRARPAEVEEEEAEEFDSAESAYPNPLPLDVVDASAYPFRTQCPLIAMDQIWAAQREIDEASRDAKEGRIEEALTRLAMGQDRLQVAIDQIVMHEFILTGNPAIIEPVMKRLGQLARADAEDAYPAD